MVSAQWLSLACTFWGFTEEMGEWEREIKREGGKEGGRGRQNGAFGRHSTHKEKQRRKCRSKLKTAGEAETNFIEKNILI